MLKKSCSGCNRKIDRKFDFCPWCGYSHKKELEEDNFGMLGRDDVMVNQQENNQIKMPFGLDGMSNSLIKQLEKEMSSMESSQGRPGGFKIQISTGSPRMQMVEKTNPSNRVQAFPNISNEENARRASLERVEAKSVIRRLPEGIIYEIDAPGVKSTKDILITKLEESLEIKAYSEDKCYVKTIPMKVEITGIYVKDGKVFLNIKG